MIIDLILMVSSKITLSLTKHEVISILVFFSELEQDKKTVDRPIKTMRLMKVHRLPCPLLMKT
ncbi:MAG: hypothetical protein A2Y97_13745 [Nitrospirae bacterium RBG_13_39_12]|nr:MAG: hypothetical protein A2Y97_13745 [Nitrospirae bacterium RBG_13_39_12]